MKTVQCTVVLGGIIASIVSPHLAQGKPAALETPCRTVTDTAAMVVFAIKQMLATNNLDTTQVSLVSDSATCESVVSSYNADVDSVLRVPSGYVVRADSTYALYLPPALGTPYKTEVVVLFNSAFGILVRMAGLN